MNKKQLYQSLQHQFAGISETCRLLSEDVGHPIDPIDPNEPPTDIPTGNKMNVLVTFIGSGHIWVPPVDVVINGIQYHFYRRSQNSSSWNQSLWDSRGQVIEVEGPIRSVRFIHEQIYDSNHRDMNFKLGAVKSGVDMTIQNDHDEESDNYYAKWFRIYGNSYPQNKKDFIELADHVSVRGSVSSIVNNPFYHYENIPLSWSQTGQFRIIVSR